MMVLWSSWCDCVVDRPWKSDFWLYFSFLWSVVLQQNQSQHSVENLYFSRCSNLCQWQEKLQQNVLDECYRCSVLETCFLKLCVCKGSDRGDFWGVNAFYFLTWSLRGISQMLEAKQYVCFLSQLTWTVRQSNANCRNDATEIKSLHTGSSCRKQLMVTRVASVALAVRQEHKLEQ